MKNKLIKDILKTIILIILNNLSDKISLSDVDELDNYLIKLEE